MASKKPRTRYRQPVYWSADESRAIITIISDLGVVAELDKKRQRNFAIFEQVRQLLAARGIYRTIPQVREKWKKLKEKFLAAKARALASPEGSPTFPYMAEMEELLGSRRAPCELQPHELRSFSPLAARGDHDTHDGADFVVTPGPSGSHLGCSTRSAQLQESYIDTDEDESEDDSEEDDFEEEEEEEEEEEGYSELEDDGQRAADSAGPGWSHGAPVDDGWDVPPPPPSPPSSSSSVLHRSHKSAGGTHRSRDRLPQPPRGEFPQVRWEDLSADGRMILLCHQETMRFLRREARRSERERQRSQRRRARVAQQVVDAFANALSSLASSLLDPSKRDPDSLEPRGPPDHPSNGITR